MNYLTKRQMATYRSRLTRAVNSGEPERIIETVDETFREWDEGGYAWPDSWHRWNIARDDARYAQQRAETSWI